MTTTPTPTPSTPIPPAFDPTTQQINGTPGNYHYVPYVADGPLATQLSETVGAVGQTIGEGIDIAVEAGEFIESGGIDVQEFVNPGFADVLEAGGKAAGYGIGWVSDNIDQLGRNLQTFASSFNDDSSTSGGDDPD